LAGDPAAHPTFLHESKRTETPIDCGATRNPAHRRHVPENEDLRDAEVGRSGVAAKILSFSVEAMRSRR